MAAPPVDCPADCGWTWTQTWFGDCVCGDRDEASFLLGLASILAWGTAELPQIYANFKNGKSEGVSFAFVATWLTGDCFNLLGCAVSPTLPTQLYTALLYTATTIVLIVQHVYYNARRAESSDARILKNLPEEDLEDLEARLLDDSHPESPESPAGEGEEDDAATPEGGESESRDASDAEDSSDDEERRRPRVRRDSGAFSVASAASEAASELAERGEAAAETARRPSTRRVSFGGSAGGHRAARHSLPSSTKPSSARTGRREGGSASRDRDRGGANASGGGSGGLISASVPSRGGFSAWLAGASTPGSSRAPEGSAPSSARTFIAGTTTSGFSRSSGPGRRSVDASGRVRVEGFHQRRDGEAARARRASFSLWPLSRNPSASGEGGEGNEGVNEGNEGNEGGSAARRGRRGGGLSRAVAAAAATTGSVGVAAFGGLRSARRGNCFSTPPRGVGVRRALLSAAAGYNHKPLIGSAPSWLGPALGWAMTGIYLGGRVPQIVLNHRRGSVEGLSISMFALAVLGNATYMASILARSCAWWRIKPNLPWLTDAAACLLMDAVILSQYWRFKGEERRRRASERLS